MNPIGIILYALSLWLGGGQPTPPRPPIVVMDAVGSDWLGPAYCGQGDASHCELRFREASDPRWIHHPVRVDRSPGIPVLDLLIDLNPNTLYVIEVRTTNTVTGQFSDWVQIAAQTNP